MSATAYVDTPYAPFVEAVADALLDKEGFLVELGTAADSVQLATSGANSFGVLFRKEKGNPHVNVRVLGKGGTVRVVAGGAIPKGSQVIWGTGGKVVVLPASAGTYRVIGRKLTQGTSADGHVIEILDDPETVTVS